MDLSSTRHETDCRDSFGSIEVVDGRNPDVALFHNRIPETTGEHRSEPIPTTVSPATTEWTRLDTFRERINGNGPEILRTYPTYSREDSMANPVRNKEQPKTSFSRSPVVLSGSDTMGLTNPHPSLHHQGCLCWISWLWSVLPNF